VVDLVLVAAGDLERDRFVEGEVGTAVERQELLPVELEGDRHHRSLGSRPGGAVARDFEDLRLREDRGVELGGVLAFGVEPETRGQLRHRSLLSSGSSTN
jgi:hypothetical protein